VTEVYVDVGAASIESAPGGGNAYERIPLPADPEAVKALRYLSEAGVRVFVVAAGGASPSDELRAAASEVLSAVPERPNAPAWYLTNDIERCQGSSARLKTVYVGGTPPSGSIRRCDTVARDIQAAAMEILAADAMAPQR
jgi:hypothetical protein